ncbi:protein transporter tim10 [Polyrhizophydium stewartii]|uniref:Mitochondrial import inner membrane translocase subunit n=1 Tax=Polyrhizophydium stewartii TaxID=2732419 RepID=A0ABR4N7D4_9FUNG
MSTLGRPGNKSMALLQIEQQLLMTTQLLSGALKNCHTKCINTEYRDGELHKGESVCVDRCVSKFLEVNIFIMKKFQEKQEQEGL